MCRLFGMSAAPARVRATFWLLDANDSLAEQSRHNPDGTGLGTFDADGTPRVDKQPLAAYEDTEFAAEARQCESTTFLAHVRHATTGALTVDNTHPFVQDGRIFAHNGVVRDLPALEAQLGPYREQVHGETDSERLFALITKHIAEHGGDVAAGIRTALRWVAGHLPIYAVNLLLTMPTELWAVRYPDTHGLYVLAREPGGGTGRHLEHASPAGTVRVRSGDLIDSPAVVVASERMDDNPAWRQLAPGELLHVDGQLRVTSHVVLDRPPAHQLTLADLGAAARAQLSH
ncbi:class II glutamine amidotransferase [Kutzneria viridogrisea]|uniref:Glutamine amidotransferase type-2 domain-containing protein n=2 Tax=Kutzneria TaxID=43356 RepID=W5WAB1_9PSEU|nr:class II glutamine amidotransferase [Kutzneria albida]AHH98083.1 hypothetical protein KALB_4721 [Kutzneria albida DSM 43870]MBA8924256.1 glutamine amidotransferase [Kutzneria viridogrisea]